MPDPPHRREAITLQWRDISTAAACGLGAWVCNEFLFALNGPSLALRIAVIPAFLAAMLHSPAWAARLVLFLGIAFDDRPRGVHLIPIMERGDYGYFSPNAASFPGLSTSLTTLLMGALLLYAVARSRGLWGRRSWAAWIILVVLAWGAVVGLGSAVVRGYFEPGRFITDLKYPLLIFSGFLAMGSESGSTARGFVRFLVWLAVVVGVITVTNALADVAQSRFLLNYNTSVFFSVGALALILAAGDLSRWPTRFATVLIAGSCFPLTRGEQLVLGVNLAVLVALVLAQSRHFVTAVKRGTVAGLAAVTIAGVALSVTRQSDETARFVSEKFELFRTLGRSLDKSALVRIAEWEETLRVGDPQDLPGLLLGRGFGGAIPIGVAFRGLPLDYADYSPEELALGRAYQPHLFLTYWLLKFGLMGTAVFLLLHGVPILGSSGLPRIALICFTFPILWQAYWVPVYAFLCGALIAFSSRRGRHPSPHSPSVGSSAEAHAA